MSVPYDDLSLFFRILQAYEARHSLSECLKLVDDAIMGDEVMCKVTEIRDNLVALEQSNSAVDIRKLQRSVENAILPNSDVVRNALKLLLALMGWREHYAHVAECICEHALTGDGLLQHERDELLVLGLGWSAMSLGLSLRGSDKFSYIYDKEARAAGYELSVRIRQIDNLAPMLDVAVQHADKPVARFATLPDGVVAGMPCSISGYVPSEMYRAGFDNPAFSTGELARRIAERFPLARPACEEVINAPHDAASVRDLIKKLKELSTDCYDTRGEVEGLTFALAQAGDHDSLIRSAKFAFTRGYHGDDEDLLLYALAALGMAAGAVKPSITEAIENPVGGRLRDTAWVCKQILTKRIREATERKEVSFIEGEIAAAEERHADELAEKESGMSDEEVDAIADEVEAEGHERPSRAEVRDVVHEKAKVSALMLLRNKQKLAQRRQERIQVVIEIGNPDIKHDSATALRAVSKLKEPLPMAPFPADLAAWRDQLLAEFPHCSTALDAIYDDLCKRRREGLKGYYVRPLLLVGPPGTGKSRLARRVAETAGLPFKSYSAGGIADAHFGGLSRGWHGGHPSVPLELIRQSQRPNPLILVDEVEKSATSRHNGSLVDCLIGMLEPETAKAWSDPFTQGPVNFSVVNWLFTANESECLPGPFRDRCRVVRVEAPLAEHVPQLARSVLKDLAPVAGVADWVQPLSQEEIEAITETWATGSRSIRALKRIVEAVLKARDLSAIRH